MLVLKQMLKQNSVQNMHRSPFMPGMGAVLTGPVLMASSKMLT